MKTPTIVLTLLLLAASGCVGCATPPPPVKLPGCGWVGKGNPKLLGPEDMEIDLSRDETSPPRVFVSSQDRRIPKGSPPPPGTLFRLEFSPEDPNSRPLPSPLSFVGRDAWPLHPHGLATARRGDRVFLQVINHPRMAMFEPDPSGLPTDAIEIYEVWDEELKFASRIVDPLLSNANDLFAFPDGDLYVSLDHGSSGGLSRTLEDIFGLRRSKVLLVRGGAVTVAADGLAFANGVLGDHTGKRLYVAATRDSALYVYAREPRTGGLTLERRVPLPTQPDNLSWEDESEKSILLAGHSSSWRFIKHMQDAAEPAPTQIYRYTPKDGSIVPVYTEDGTLLPAASGALRVGDLLLMGQIFDAGILACKLSN